MFVPALIPRSQELLPRKGGGGLGGGEIGDPDIGSVPGIGSDPIGTDGDEPLSTNPSGEEPFGTNPSGEEPFGTNPSGEEPFSTDGEGSSSGGGGSGSSKGTGSSGSTGVPSSVSVSGVTGDRTTALSYGGGGGKASTIPAGQPFAGRLSGGGTRDEVYGTSVYGSGYPGVNGAGVAGRNFPFAFWPIVWGKRLYGAAYLHDDEYGDPTNTSRPGGSMMQAKFTSSGSGNSTFHVVADNTTVTSLISSIDANCTLGTGSSSAPLPFNGSASDPLPEQAIEYYRASSVVLTLDGYNNTVALGDQPNATAVPLPSGVDTTLLNCLNFTIGEAVPLISGAEQLRSFPSPLLLVIVSVVWLLR